MARIPSTRSTAFWLAGLVLVAGLLLPAQEAGAQAIKVTSAVPDITDQGTVDLVVAIGGENFGRNSRVSFFVTGTTNPGGITVKNVRYKDSGNLDATIDVAPDAQTDLKFDIQVQSGSRTGKGTELFSVRVKQNTELPPGSVFDLQATAVTFNTATFTWTAPADDGYDPSSGPAAEYRFYVRKGYDAATPDCGPFTLDGPLGGEDPCHAASWARLWPSDPGMTDTYCYGYLAPSSQYWAMVRTLDDAPPGGQWSVLADDLAHQIPFTTADFPPTNWVAESVDPESAGSTVGLPVLDFDPAGSPALFYVQDGVGRLATWDGSGWLFEPVGATFGGGYDFGFDPASGQATIVALVPAGSKQALKFYRRTGATADPWAAETVATGNIETSGILRFNPSDARATIAYALIRGTSQVIRVAERIGSAWTSEEVAVAALRRRFGLAFDCGGNPAVAFSYGGGDTQVLRFAVRQGASWPLETADPGPGAPFTWMTFNALAFDPVHGDFAAAAVFSEPVGRSEHAQLRYCERAAGSWTCTTLAETHDGFSTLSLAFSVDGTVHLTYKNRYTTRFDAVRPPGGPWTHEAVDWNCQGDADLGIGPDGQPYISYNGFFNAVTSLNPPDPVRFARRSPWP